MRRALLSVSEKSGVETLARSLSELGFELLSTGGTARALRAAGLAVSEVSDLTGQPRGHGRSRQDPAPAVFASILADLDVPEHREVLAEWGLDPVSLVVVNLYPFAATAARPGVTPGELIENIDIGGPVADPRGGQEPPPRHRRRGPRRLSARAGRAARRRGPAAAAAGAGGQGVPPHRRLRRDDRQRPPDAPRNVSPTSPSMPSLPGWPPRASRCATARTPTSTPCCSGRPSRRASPRSVSSRARSCPTTTCWTRTEPGGWSATCRVRASSIVKHAAPCGVGLGERAEAPIASPSPATRCRRSAASSPRRCRWTRLPPGHGRAVRRGRRRAGVHDGGPGSPRGQEEPAGAHGAAPAAGQPRLRAIDGGLLVQSPDEGWDEEWQVVTDRPPDQAEEQAPARSPGGSPSTRSRTPSSSPARRPPSASAAASPAASTRAASPSSEPGPSASRWPAPPPGSDAFFPFPDGVETLAAAGITAVVATRRLGTRQGRDRRRRPPGHGHGLHRPPSLPALSRPWCASSPSCWPPLLRPLRRLPSLPPSRPGWPQLPAWQADFVQEFVPSGFSEGTKDAGTLVLAPPSRLRFDYGASGRIFAVSGNVARHVDLPAGACDAVLLSASTWSRLPLASILDPAAAVAAFAIAEVTGSHPSRAAGADLRARPASRSRSTRQATWRRSWSSTRPETATRSPSARGGASRAQPVSRFEPALAGHAPCRPEGS